MKISVVGSGYVGLVTGTCFSEVGNSVICVDNNSEKIEKLNQGIIPIYEPGLEEMVKLNKQQNRLSFTTDIKTAIENTKMCFIAVGTPPDEDGSADLQYVLAVARDIGRYMNDYKIVVDKSTVPVGTADLVKAEIQKILDERGVNYGFDVVSNPEFLKEGDAIEDFMRPDRVIIGCDNARVAEAMKELYKPFNRSSDRVIILGIRSAEMTKYAANAMLATKISFMNELSHLCEAMGADINEVRSGIGSDTRIGYKFIYAGIGYGGSCFPKDVKALVHMAKQNNTKYRLLQAVEDVNYDQKFYLVEKAKKHFQNNLQGKVFALWGLAFKPRTDDMREAPSIIIINELIKLGASVIVYDPVAMEEAKRIFGSNPHITYAEDDYTALKNADALMLITEWHQFRFPNFAQMRELLKNPVIFDGRNQYDARHVEELGFTYYCVGRK